MESLVFDLRYAVRALRRSPGFTGACVLTLALGIGAATAVFSVAYGVLLRPLPYADPDRVVTVWASWDNFPDKTWLSVPEYQLFHQESRALADLGLYRIGSTSFTSPEGAEQVGAAFVTPNVFDILGAAPWLGRAFSWDEARDGDAGIVLAYDAWMRRYAGDPSVVGGTIEVDGGSQRVLGVLPEGFALPLDLAATSSSEVYFPFWVDLESPAPDLGSGGSHGSYGVGRLAAGASVEDARADLARVMSMVAPVGLYGPERRFTPRVFGARDDVVGSAGTTVLVLLGAVALLLLIACVNVASLLISRSDTRSAEVAVRAAMGAGGGRIARQLLAESLLIAVTAGALGFLLAAVGVDALLAIDPTAVPRSGEVRLDARIAIFTSVLTLGTAFVFGLVPAVQLARRGVQRGLRTATRGARGDAGSGRARRLLVASQMAMAVVLLTASGLLMRSFVSLLGVDVGIARADVLTARITAPAFVYPDAAAVAAFYEELLDRLEDVPGVERAAAVRLLPLASTMGDAYFRPVSYAPAEGESTQGEWEWATPGYFEIMGIPLVAGRTFDERDRRADQTAVIVNETMARRYWGTEDPIGSAVIATGVPNTAVVVGVVGDVRHNGVIAEPKPQYYVPHAQIVDDMAATMRGMTLTIATDGDPRDFVEPVRAELRALAPMVPLSQVATLDDALARSVAQPRFALLLLGAFAVLALVLAIVGVYGMLSYVVSRRTREIGIRLALGAESGAVVRAVTLEGARVAAAGTLVGAAAAWSASGLMSGMLFGVTPHDPTTFVTTVGLFMAVAVVASWVPAARAARIHPVEAIRSE
ncbi:MAG: ABC transporter permease [Gemmatimonadales bacterium]